MRLLALFLDFLHTEVTDFPILSYTYISEIFILWHAWSLKKVPLSGGASLYKPVYWGCPPGSIASEAND